MAAIEHQIGDNQEPDPRVVDQILQDLNSDGNMVIFPFQRLRFQNNGYLVDPEFNRELKFFWELLIQPKPVNNEFFPEVINNPATQKKLTEEKQSETVETNEYYHVGPGPILTHDEYMRQLQMGEEIKRNCHKFQWGT